MIPSRYTKKPVTIEATRLNWVNIHDVAMWCGGTLIYGPKGELEMIVIPTLEGTMTAYLGWWVIRGVKDEFYPCRNDVFEATYEQAEDLRVGTATPRWPRGG